MKLTREEDRYLSFQTSCMVNDCDKVLKIELVNRKICFSKVALFLVINIIVQKVQNN